MTLHGVTGLVLAAGHSRRMGFPKALVDYRGEPLVRAHCEQMRCLGVARVIVVVGGEDAARIREAVPADDAIDWIVNPAPRHGPFSSLILALARAHRDGVADPPCVMTPVDVPPPRGAVFEALRDAADGAEDAVCAVVPQFDGRGGHPVWLTPRGVARLRAWPVSPAHSRLDHLLALWASDVRRVAVDDAAVLHNWNTPADLGEVSAGRVEELP